MATVSPSIMYKAYRSRLRSNPCDMDMVPFPDDLPMGWDHPHTMDMAPVTKQCIAQEAKQDGSHFILIHILSLHKKNLKKNISKRIKKDAGKTAPTAFLGAYD